MYYQTTGCTQWHTNTSRKTVIILQVLHRQMRTSFKKLIDWCWYDQGSTPQKWLCSQQNFQGFNKLRIKVEGIPNRVICTASHNQLWPPEGDEVRGKECASNQNLVIELKRTTERKKERKIVHLTSTPHKGDLCLACTTITNSFPQEYKTKSKLEREAATNYLNNHS